MSNVLQCYSCGEGIMSIWNNARVVSVESKDIFSVDCEMFDFVIELFCPYCGKKHEVSHRRLPKKAILKRKMKNYLENLKREKVYCEVILQALAETVEKY